MLLEILFGSVGYPADQRTPKRLSLEYSSQCHQLASRGSQKLKHNKMDRMSKIVETLTQKLSLGAKVLRVGGTEKIFRYNFSLMEGEKLIKASQCYISTTAGPIASILFITTDRVAFCSEKSIELSSPTGKFIRIPYNVSIPIEMISREAFTRDVQSIRRWEFKGWDPGRLITEEERGSSGLFMWELWLLCKVTFFDGSPKREEAFTRDVRIKRWLKKWLKECSAKGFWFLITSNSLTKQINYERM